VGGAVTVGVAAVAYFFLPDYPHNTRWLSERERAVAQLRMTADRGTTDYSVRKRDGFKMAIASLRVWLFAGMYFFMSFGTSLHNFFPTLVQTLGFSRHTTLWLTVPPYLLAVVVAISTALSSDRRRNASFHIAGMAAISLAGFLTYLVEQSHDDQGLWIRYASSYLMLCGAHAANPVILGWAQKTVRHPREMRATMLAIVNAAGSMAQVS
jgi:hypothetical protein